MRESPLALRERGSDVQLDDQGNVVGGLLPAAHVAVDRDAGQMVRRLWREQKNLEVPCRLHARCLCLKNRHQVGLERAEWRDI